MLVSMAGPNGVWNVGDPYECGEAEAVRLIQAGMATPIAEQTIERAVKPLGKAEKRKAK